MLNQMKRVLELCVKISTKTKADCFFGYDPHCDSYHVSLYREGWYEGADAEWIDMVTKCGAHNLDRTIVRLKEIYKVLKEKENGK